MDELLDRYLAEEARQEKEWYDSLPYCEVCGEKIQETGYNIFDCWFCQDCIEDMRKDFI